MNLNLELYKKLVAVRRTSGEDVDKTYLNLATQAELAGNDRFVWKGQTVKIRRDPKILN